MRGEYCKFCVDEDISLILVHCLKNHIPRTCGGKSNNKTKPKQDQGYGGISHP